MGILQLISVGFLIGSLFTLFIKEAQLLITVKTLTENYPPELFVLGLKKKKKLQQTIPPSAESPLHFLTISPSFISKPLMIQWVMRTQW